MKRDVDRIYILEVVERFHKDRIYILDVDKRFHKDSRDLISLE